MAVQISGAQRESHRISGDFRTREKSAIFALTDHFDRPATYVSVIVSVQGIGAVVGVSLPLLVVAS